MPCPHSPVETCELCAATLDSEGGKTLVRGEQPRLDDGQLAPGSIIGRYVVVDRLGQGGMGVVYTARDPQLERVVAVKVLRSRGGAASEAAQVRLLREAQAMAQLAHPNVVPVYDSGPWGQGVFIVMELVRGATLDTWMKVAPRAWRDVIALFVQAGRGLEAAHATGLIHRDFKPANVLVGEDGRPRVTDFGLARVSGERTPSLPSSGPGGSPLSLDTPLTLAGTMMGSPGYMAPEQYAGAETTAATDQFAFCVSLYEALYGARPFVAKTIPELELVTSRGVVPPAPKGSPVPAWVHRILVRGLSPDASKRHASMTSLLRALTDDPSLKRRRWYAVGAAVVVLVAAMGGTWWTGARRQAQACRGAGALLEGVWDAPLRARGEKAFLATNLPFAGSTWVLTRDALDAWAAEWVAARTEACEATRVRGENTERQLLLRFECLDRRHEELAALAQAFLSADVELVTNAPTAAAGLSPVASCANLKQLEDRRAPPPTLVGQARELAQQVAQARALVAASRHREARPRLEAVVERAAGLKLAVEADALEALGDLESAARDFVRARTAYEGALRAAEVAGDDVQAARVLSRMVSVVGWRLEHPAEARTWAALASGVVERIGGDGLILARIEEGLGDTEWQDGRRTHALAAYRRSLALYVAAQGAESLDVARLHSATAWVLTEQGELEEAREVLERSRAMRERLLGPRHPGLSESYNELSMLALEQRDLEASVAWARQNVAVQTALGAPRSILSAKATLVSALAAAEPAGALALLDEMRPELEVEERSALVRECQQGRVDALTAVGRAKEALLEGRVWLAERQRLLGRQHPEVLALAASVSGAAAAEGAWAEAREGAERYLEGKAALGGLDSPRTGLVLLRSAQAHLALGTPRDATSRAERAVAALSRGPISRGLRGEARRVFAEALLRTRQDPERAALLLLQAKEDAQAAGDEALLARVAKLTK